MRKHNILKNLFACIALVFIAVSCDDDTGNIGGKVMPGYDELKITQGIFSVFSRSIKADSVLGTTSTSYLGKITDPETNSTTYCDFLAQFHALENFSFPAADSLVQDNNVIEADSIELNLYIDSYYGDSLNSMKLGIYELDTANAMNENMIYYSNMDPWKYVNNKENAIRKEISFAVVDMALSDSMQTLYSSSLQRKIRIKLPTEYGTFIMRKYYENPNNFKNTYNFIHHVCPGFYYRILSGNGTMLNIDNAIMTIHFRYMQNDSIYNGYQKVAATEEVLQNTRIENKNIEPLLETEDYTYLKTPVGIYTEVTLPIDSIYSDEHINDTLNSAKISFARVNDSKLTEYNLPKPQTLLMLKSEELYSFFENSKVADGETSYVATFASSDNAYTFENISLLVSNIYNTRKTESGVTANDSEATIKAKYAKWEAKHPLWNKVTLVPVTTTYSQQSNGYTTQNVLTRVRNDLSLASTRLVGGNTGEIKMSVIYSRFKQ